MVLFRFFFIFSLFSFIYSQEGCSPLQDCIKCSKEEMSESYCLNNGYKVLVRCRENEEIIDKYNNCVINSSPEIKVSSYTLSPVITFQILMAIFGGLAYWGVQSHRESSMTQFDSRRYRQRYSHIQTV